MTIAIKLDAMFANAQAMAQLIENDPNPQRTMYVRLIGELEAVMLGAYRSGGKKTRDYLEGHLESIMKRQEREIAVRREKLQEDAEVARRLEAYSE